MDIKFVLNDYYEVLKLLCENEGPVPELSETAIQLTQQQIAEALNCSKMKVNGMFITLQREKFVKQKSRVRYSVTDRARNAVRLLESFKEQMAEIE